MKIGLIDVDGHNFPNLALMRISSHHKQKGDTVDVTDAEYGKRIYDMRKREHLCVRCGKKDEMTMRGKVCCARCSDIKNDHNRQYRQNNPDKINILKKRLTEYRIENRLCVCCGKPVSENGVHKYCQSCLNKEKLRQRRLYAAGYRCPKRRPNGPKPYDGIPRNEWPEFGFCYRCGEPLDRKGKLCKKCYATTCANLARCREVKKGTIQITVGCRTIEHVGDM